MARSVGSDEENHWTWTGNSASKAEVSLGAFELHGAALTAEVNSAERGTRARELIERLAGHAVRHRGTSHEDVGRKVAECLKAKALGHEDEDEDEQDNVRASAPSIAPEVAEAFVAEHYSRHYRAWVDEPVPALDDKTPREAAKVREMRPRVEDLIHGLEGMYERALKDGQPAYDPSWMWAELGLETAVDPSRPPPLAHERVAERVPGSAEASRAVAERVRSLPSFSDATTTLDEDDIQADLDLQRFLRRERPAANDAGQDGSAAAPYLPLMVNLDLHRRKVFWVDPALSYMLENTDVDVGGRELRTPFPAFAIALTDRHALSLGERLLSRRTTDPLRGHILRVATVYVMERGGQEGRSLSMVFAFDALGADLPSLIHYECSSQRRGLGQGLSRLHCTRACHRAPGA